jgi:hypothetical protein
MMRVDKQTLTVQKAIRSTKELQYICSTKVISSAIQEWCDSRPDNEQLQNVRAEWLNVLFYVNSLELDAHSYGKAYSDLLERKNKEIEELRELVGKISDDNIEKDTNIVR